jgi:ABC-type Mn2+/Zn2+ transport system permease subunit
LIAEFVASWPLFHNSYVTGWLIGLLLSLFGVIVVARDQIFIGAAVSQASTLGIAAGMSLANAFAAQAAWLESDAFLRGTAVAASVTAALLTARGGGAGRESHEAISGWVFLVSASLSVLLVSHSPHGLEEIHRVASSSIVGATGADAWTFGALAACTAAILALRQRRILLLTLDPPMASAVGIRRHTWELAIAAWIGAGVGLSISVAGMLYTFGCLVLPALAARGLCREVRSMFFVSPVVSIACGVPAFAIANHHDYPPAQMAVALQAGALLAAWAVRRVRG